VKMGMWGEMMPKRCLLDFPTKISPYVLGIIGSATNHMFFMVLCPYTYLDWRGCSNILFTLNEPQYDRGNISVLFKLI
jgi:hypothetical protein